MVRRKRFVRHGGRPRASMPQIPQKILCGGMTDRVLKLSRIVTILSVESLNAPDQPNDGATLGFTAGGEALRFVLSRKVLVTLSERMAEFLKGSTKEDLFYMAFLDELAPESDVYFNLSRTQYIDIMDALTEIRLTLSAGYVEGKLDG